MNKAKLIAAFAQEMQISKAEAEKYVNGLFGIIKKSLQEGNKVAVFGFGKFEVGKRKKCKIRNPQNPNEWIQVDEKNVPRFTAGKDLKEAVNGKKAS